MAAPPSDHLDQVGFLLVPGFALLSYASTIEPLRAANQLAGRALYHWTHLTPDGLPAAASNGVRIPADAPLAEAPVLDTVIVCAGGNPADFRDPATLSWLRRAGQRRIRLGGVSGGPWVLARAGVLRGYRMTLHWEHAAAFAEEFPELDLRRSLFELDRDRLTCSGGTAALDMMHALIAREYGLPLAMEVSEWFLQTQVREGTNSQRMALRDRTGIASRAVLRALAAMEPSTEAPLPRAALAAAAGVSPRHLERLFRQHLGRTPGEHYLRLRLDRARLLLRQSELSVLGVAVACGFASASHFTRAYRRTFGRAPSSERSGAG